jgi:RimJ/RimL family protein N-acetyltransferase
MVRELLHIAHASDATLTVVAQTENVENAANTILKNLGFQFVAEQVEPDGDVVWQWHRTLARNAARS